MKMIQAKQSKQKQKQNIFMDDMRHILFIIIFILNNKMNILFFFFTNFKNK